MRLASMDAENDPRKSNLMIYFLAILAALVVCVLLIFFTRVLVIIFKYAFEHYIWIAGVIVVLMVLRKLMFGPKRVPVPNPQQYY